MLIALDNTQPEKKIGIAAPSKTGISAWRGFGLSVFILLLIMTEMLLPRLPGGDRPNLPLFLIGVIFVIAFNFKYLAQNFTYLVRPPFIFFALYLLWMLASVLWSYLPLETLFHAGCFILGFAGALCFADVPIKVAANKIIRIIAMVCIASWLFLIINYHAATIATDLWRLNGIMINCQRLCLLAGLALIIMMALWTRKNDEFEGILSNKAALFGLVILFLLTILATKTRAFSTFAVFSCLCVFMANAKAGTKVTLILAGVFIASIVLLNAEIISGLYTREETNDATLTGRVTIWIKSMEMIAAKPFIGYGYSTFFSDLTQGFFSFAMVYHAHNTWLNAAFETGIIGAGLLSLFLLGVIGRDIKSYFSKKRLPIGTGLMIMALICGLMGVLYGGKMGMPVGIITMIFLQETVIRRREKPVYDNLSK